MPTQMQGRATTSSDLPGLQLSHLPPDMEDIDEGSLFVILQMRKIVVEYFVYKNIFSHLVF